MRRVTTALSSRSPRNLGKIRPFEVSPGRPARPIRCRPRATDFGDRPDHEIDRAHVDPELERGGGDQARGISPDLSCSSTPVRSSWESEP